MALANQADIFREAREIAQRNSLTLFDRYIGGGKRGGQTISEFENPFRADKNTKSSIYYVHDGKFVDYATGDQHDWVDYLVEKGEAANALEAAKLIIRQYGNGFDPAPAARPQQGKTDKTAEWTPIRPIPASVKLPTGKNEKKNGQWITRQWKAIWPYYDSQGGLVGYVARFDALDDDGQPVMSRKGKPEKDFFPLVWARNGQNPDECKWKWRGLPKPRPLYALPTLLEHPEADVLMVSGEKCADAANAIFERGGFAWVAVTWAGGDNAIEGTDWAGLKGRRLVYWPDNDDGSKKSMAALRAKLGGRVLKVPKDRPAGWDIADAIAEGWTGDQVMAFIETAPESGEKTGAALPPAPPDKLKLGEIPSGWLVIDTGIMELRKAGQEDEYYVPICQNPAILTKYLRNIDKKTEKAEISFVKKDGAVDTLICPCSTVFNRASIISLTDRGLKFTSETSKSLVRYFEAYGRANNIPLAKSIARMGWVGDDRFFPYCQDIIFEDDVNSGLYEAMQPQGEFEDWQNIVGALRKYDDVRFVIAASLAAPLVYRLKHQTFVIHIWGDSRSGKSAANKAALSIWGKPSLFMETFNATLVGLERKCAVLHHLPLLIDERQVLNKKLDSEQMIYMLCEQKGRGRGSRSGGLQDMPTWANLIMTNGEEPLTSSASNQGAKNRTVELYFERFEDIERLRAIHGFVDENYATAGPIYIDGVKGRDNIRLDYAQMYAELRGFSAGCDHVQNIALVCLADFYGGLFLWEQSETEAYREAVNLGERIIEKLSKEDRPDIYESAWEFIKGWYVSNQNYFSDSDLGPQYGTATSSEVLILPEYLDAALKEKGYSSRKIAKEFARRRYFLSETEGGKTRVTLQRRINGIKKRMYVIPRLLLQADNDNDGTLFSNSEGQARQHWNN